MSVSTSASRLSAFQELGGLLQVRSTVTETWTPKALWGAEGRLCTVHIPSPPPFV